ncbi:hypothetical protein PBT90_08685 [Algoriphagus halophytocola]|uniref:Phage protein n=1 Tax=Algoriphagus halophytocola TaxID=2991499 RepID=A0ABY6MI54_9BACT|nr:MULTISPECIES: hypothetical protein [unclassified Algoriphagus]UZD23462.1 hypothetical protein OM944_03005 [Algoriphagus sp. TR-M5]WBL44757.1 hypothetical protein PBT90_08685 [Algoriphagus sp. TR-M9]
MFDGPDYPQSIKEELFESWLEEGRAHVIGYHYLLIVWNVYDEKYNSVYVETRDEISSYELYPNARGPEALIAAYDLYSEGRIQL